jgi:hypothetical protein
MKRIALTTAWAVTATVLTASSCTKSDVPAPATPASAPAATRTAVAQPSANVPVSGHLVKLADGVDLEQVRNQDMVHPAFSISAPDVTAPVLFADASNDKNDASAPVILKKIDDKWRILELTDTGNQEWVYAGACGPRHELWAILDSAGESAAPQLTLMRSSDEGLTWQYFAAVKKPTDDAEFIAFTMAANGAGKMTMHLSDDADTIPHGYYDYRTNDGGKTWTGPAFEADDMTDADTQHDTDSLQDAIKDAEAVPAN